MRAFILSVAMAIGLVAPGLSLSEQHSLQQAGAFGHHPIHVLLLGDSIALTLGIGLAHDTHSHYGVVFSNHSTLGCDLDPTLEIFTSGKPGPATPGCDNWQALWPFLTAAVHPQVVVLGIGRWEVSDHFYKGHWVHIGQKAWDKHLTKDLRQAISILHLFGAKVVLLTMPYVDPSDRQADGAPWVENTPARARLYNQLIKHLAQRDPHTVTVIDLNKMLSPKGHYTSTVDGVRVRWTDGVHITISGGEFLQHEILPVVDQLGLQAEAAQHQGGGGNLVSDVVAKKKPAS